MRYAAPVMQDRPTDTGAAAGKAPLLATLRRYFPGFAPEIVFDVGANEGATSLALAAAFPEATIFAFEPVASTFAVLQARVVAQERIKPFPLALGWRSGAARMRIMGVSVSNRIAGWRDLRKPTEPVSIRRGDDFCAEQGIAEIGLLKIDAEGHDLHVLRGFRAMLKAGRIAVVEAEVGMSPESRHHAALEPVKAFMERRGYRLVLVYEQVPDTAFSGRAAMRRANVVFASPQLLERSRAERPRI